MPGLRSLGRLYQGYLWLWVSHLADYAASMLLLHSSVSLFVSFMKMYSFLALSTMSLSVQRSVS